MPWKSLYDLDPGLRRWAARLVPASVRGWLRVNYVLFLQMGHWNSLRTRRVQWPGEGAVPWFTYGAVEYLRQFDFTGKALFEYGSGHSSLFWAQRGARVTTVDHDPEWHAWVRANVPPTVTALCETSEERYVDSLVAAGGAFDVIVLDGAFRDACAAVATSRLRPGGLIVLDNSDFYPGAARMLRQADLLQVDFFGFSAAEAFRQVTSFFFSRDFRFPTRDADQPCEPVGGMPLSEFRRIQNLVVPKKPPRA